MRACVRAVEKGDDEQSNTMAMAFDVGNEIRQAAAKVCMYVAKSRLCAGESKICRNRPDRARARFVIGAAGRAGFRFSAHTFRRACARLVVFVLLSHIIFRFTNHHHNTGEDEVLRSYVQHGIDERA